MRYCFASGNVIGGVPTPSDSRPVGDDNQKCCANHETEQDQPVRLDYGFELVNQSFCLWNMLEEGNTRFRINIES